MARDKLAIAVLGAGAMGKEHASILGEMPDVQVVAVFSRDREHAASVAALCGARAFTDIEALLNEAKIDAVDVCLPSNAHKGTVIAALDRKRHVFCETPLALDLGEARDMLAAGRRADRLLQVGLLMRSIAPYQHIKEIVSAGTCGRLLSVSAYRHGSYLRPGAPDHKAHYSDPSTELMTFDFDFIGWVMGRPERVSASAASSAQGGVGEITALLHYADGRHATVTGSGIMPKGFAYAVGFRALFQEAAFELRATFAGDGRPQSAFTRWAGEASPELIKLEGRNPYAVELERFVKCIRGEADPELLDAERAIESLVLSIAVQQSLKEGRTIKIAE
jgi:predicted dehydrogenase